MGRRLVGNPIEVALSRAAPHEHRAQPLPQLVRPAEILLLSDVTIAYDRHPVVHHISGAFEAGSLTALVGPNGAGKSTLLKAIAGVQAVTAGQIQFGIDRRAVAYLPQVVDVDRSFPLRVIDVVGFRPLAQGRRAAPSHRCGSRGQRCRHRGGRFGGARAPADRQAVGRPVPARAVRAADGAGSGADPARRAVQRDRPEDHRRSDAGRHATGRPKAAR